MLRVLISDPNSSLRGLADAGRQRSFGRRTVQPKSSNQRRYLEAIEGHDMVFGIGPAGTGKTYLAVAMAISALLAKRVNRIILARPAVEAGERLGFLPGTLQDKIDPYLRRSMTLYMTCSIPKGRSLPGEERHRDRAHRVHARTDAERLVRDSRRSAEHDFRAKMFVRLGFNSKAVITGDVTRSTCQRAPQRARAMDVRRTSTDWFLSSSTKPMRSAITWFSALCAPTTAQDKSGRATAAPAAEPRHADAVSAEKQAAAAAGEAAIHEPKASSAEAKG
jgi:hypothetical protein